MKIKLVCIAWLLFSLSLHAEIIVAEGEKFKPLDQKGWKVTHQNDSYASHTYGGMWMSHGGCLGAPADSVGSVATQPIVVPTAGSYRVWSKYQAPPYFNFLHQIEIVQKGKVVFKHTYGKNGTDRLWSFSGVSDELWWPWGVDHDAAEAPTKPVNLAAGQAEIRLTTLANPRPAGDRFVDFVLLTTNQANDYQGFKPYKVGTPFANEAFAACKLWMRFRNTGAKPAQLAVARAGHFQPQYGGARAQFPDAPVKAGQWSSWFNVGPFCRLVHDEGLTLTLPGAEKFAVQFARDQAGKELVGDLQMNSGEVAVVPLEITWQPGARVKTSRQHAAEIIALSKKWRKANGGKKPQQVLFYGAFRSPEKWVQDFKDALGYNTQLPDGYPHVKRDGLFAHAGSPARIRKFAESLKNKQDFRVLSFGDEIHLGSINYKDPKMQAKFLKWLQTKKYTKADLGVPLNQAKLTRTGAARLAWYSHLFNEEERFASFRERTELAKKLIGPHVLTGANYSPHRLALYYGPIYQWVDIFKHNGMSMFWTEDYIFSVPEAPQIISWMFAVMRCGVKYNKQPMHFYVMPHAPGQVPGYLRRNTLLAIGNGTRHIDNFWVAPAERFTENYVGWNYRDTFRTLHEAIYDTAEAEKLQAGGTVRPARVAVVLSKATDFNESRLMVDKASDPFARRCKNAPAQLNQIICRKDQQMLYLALRQAQHAVDLVTEDDIIDGILKDYDVVYFAGEWINHLAVPKLEAWVKGGGILYCCAGAGHRNEFDEPEPALAKLLGLKGSKLQKNVAIIRTLLELPLMPSIGTITLGKDKIQAIGMKQTLMPAQAQVLGTWEDGSPAVTVNTVGKGKAYAVGTLAGNSWMKTGLRVVPFSRGGRHTLYNPEGFDTATTKLVQLGVSAAKLERPVVASRPGIEAAVIDHASGTLVTLVNWTNGPAKDLDVRVRTKGKVKQIRSVRLQKALEFTQEEGQVRFKVDLEDADYLMLHR